MKNKFLKLAGALTLAFSIFMFWGWSFFAFTVRYSGNKRLSRKKWFQLSHLKINHPRYGYKTKYEKGKEWCLKQDMRDCFTRSQDGLRLHAYYLPAKNAKRFVILCHGYKGTGFGDFANTAKFLHEHQCNLLFIDQRCCGLSQGSYITFGAMEQYDVQKWAYYVSKRNKKHLPLYLYGESMGAASVLMASGHRLPAETRGLISDCAFHSMRGQIQDMAANWFHIKWIGLLLFRLNFFCRAFAGFRMKDADTAPALAINRRPVLFFHGGDDTYVDAKNVRINYSHCTSEKECVVIPKARHLCSAYVGSKLYRKKLLEFFGKYD